MYRHSHILLLFLYIAFFGVLTFIHAPIRIILWRAQSKNVSKLFIKIGEIYESSKIPTREWNQRIDSTANIYPQKALVKRAQRDFARLPLYLRG